MHKRVFYFGLLVLTIVIGLVSTSAVAQEDDSSSGDSSQNGAESAESGEDGDASGGDSGGTNLKESLREPDQDGGFKRSNRMEFDERLVKGQAAKSGAVYLFKRTPRNLPGLVPMRRSYRKRIVEPVLRQRVLTVEDKTKKDKDAKKPETQKDELEAMRLSPMLTSDDVVESTDEEDSRKKKKKRKKKRRKRRNREKSN